MILKKVLTRLGVTERSVNLTYSQEGEDRILKRFVGDPASGFDADVEGKDLEVHESNGWTRFRPDYVLAESLPLNERWIKEDLIFDFMSSLGYVPVAKTVNAVFFKTKDQPT